MPRTTTIAMRETAPAPSRDLATGIVLAAIILLGSGCSMRHLATARLADALAESGSTYAADDDVELVGAAVPFGLKTIETLLVEQPDHRGLLLAAARGFTQYAYVYVALPADEIETRDVSAAYEARQRAARLYLRARDYGVRGLEVTHPGFGKAIALDAVDAATRLQAGDVPLMYWTAVAWAAAIGLTKDDAYLVAQLPRVNALVERALALDEGFDQGALHTFLITYATTRPGPWPATAATARRHFERAVQLSAGQQAGPYVALAEAVALVDRNRAEYETMLSRALQVDVDARAEWRLQNLVMQRKARSMLAHIDEQFSD